MTPSTVKELIFDATAFGGLAFFVAITIFAAFFDRSLSLRLAVGLVLSYIIIFSIRLLYFKRRPDGSKVIHWYDRVMQSSFPSLHATRVAVLAGILGAYFSDAWLWLLFIALVLLTGWTRWFLKRHYVSDILVGFAIGIFIAFIVIWGL